MSAVVMDRMVLRDILTAVKPGIYRSPSMPGADSVELTAVGQRLTARTCNLDVEVVAGGELAERAKGKFSATVTWSYLHRLLAAGEDTVTLSNDGYRLVVTVRPGSSVSLQHASSPPTLPHLGPSSVAVSLSPEDVRHVVSVAAAASTDNVRPVLAGVAVDARGLWAATDSYRMTWLRLGGTAGVLGGLNVPAAVWGHVAGWKDTADVEVSRIARVDDPMSETPFVQVRGVRRRGRAGVRQVDVTLITTTIVGKFPDVGKLILDLTEASSWTVPSAQLVEALRVVSVVEGSVVNMPVVLDFTRTSVTVQTANALTLRDGDDLPRCTSTVDVRSSMTPAAGVPADIVALNPKYLQQAMAALASDMVTLSLHDWCKPVVMTGSGPVQTLQMPMLEEQCTAVAEQRAADFEQRAADAEADA